MSLSMMLSQMSAGMVRTIGIFALTLLFSLPLGLIISFGRMSRHRPLALLVKFYISVMRGTPLMLQLLVVFFGPYYLFGMNIGGSWRFLAIIIGFSLNYAAYFAEIYRSGIESIPIGQYEAAKLLGYSRQQTFFRIILPQVIKRILPAVTNEIITLVKDTSLAFALAYMEMFTIAKQIAASKTTFMPFLIAAVFYYVFNLLVAVVMEAVEKKLSYYR
ncbi:MAG: amino acid ABC transporter permease [Candidatus Limivivens sp.]|nr:amino acid ABC transporter permease [Candidatus Limivivens sp.]